MEKKGNYEKGIGVHVFRVDMRFPQGTFSAQYQVK